MKKLWAVVLVGTLLLTGCSGNNNKQASSKSSESVRSTKTVAKATHAKRVTKSVKSTRSAVAMKASSQAESSSQVSATTPSASQATAPAVTRSSQSTTQTTQATATVWNATKTQQLAAFMGQWQAAMGQTYQGTYNGDNPNHLGIVFPDAITSGQLNGRVSLGGQLVNLTWSTNGENGQAYQVVAVATGNQSKLGFPTTYLFCIHNQQPVVYMSQTTNGNIFYIQNTQNAALQAGFAKIVAGQN
ncbi:DUF4767 domain-containing protein [Lactiplantibacillus daoliensis]|uniref:DUF4767 domain-containing protein n=1 Tax=Lactiplantibacillus daoliensis TaxID=2559916 RepID=A0ABW1UGN1_9LACO|nr:DUF4767 domain-containing protein [Lactiplantibacillus daoliensis]